MHLITRQSNANGAADRWAKQYGDRPSYVLAGGTVCGTTLDALRSLGPNPHPDDVDRIIGNTAWTNSGRHCRECGKDDCDTVVLGEPYDYESSTAEICGECLLKALMLIDT